MPQKAIYFSFAVKVKRTAKLDCLAWRPRVISIFDLTFGKSRSASHSFNSISVDIELNLQLSAIF